MKLSEIKAIAEKRDSGIWEQKVVPEENRKGLALLGIELVDIIQGEYHIAGDLTKSNAAFVTMAANHIDKLLAVAEAADDLLDEGLGDHFEGDESQLRKALEELEKE